MALDSDQILLGLLANPILGHASRADLEKVVPHCHLTHFRPNRIFLKEGEKAASVYALITGGVRVYHSLPTGTEIVVKLFGPPAFFGEADALLGINWLESVETVLPSDIISMPASLFAVLLRRSHALANALVVDLSTRLLIATEQARQLANGSAESTVASLLIDYLDLFGDKPVEGQGTRIDLRLSQDAIGKSLSISRKTVQRTLQKWQNEGIIGKDKGRHVVLDVAALRSRATRTHFGLAYRLEPKKSAEE
jgi:CRP-like cAMP-binding protein